MQTVKDGNNMVYATFKGIVDHFFFFSAFRRGHVNIEDNFISLGIKWNSGGLIF